MKTANTSLPLSGQVAWITGASSGLGAQLTFEFAERGADLILSARNLTNLEEVKSQLSAYPVSVHLLPLDLEQLEQLPAKVDQALSLAGRVDILVNNAGLAIRDFALATSPEVDQKLMNINYFGPVLLTKRLLPHLLARGTGQVVVVSSLSGKFGVPRTAAYAASKHALHGFFETLRSEIAPSDIHITIIVPGMIKTEITAHALQGDGSTFGRLEKSFKTAYPVKKAARKMMQAILRKREEVFVGGHERFTLFLHRLSPYLLRRFIRSHPLRRLRKWQQLFTAKKKNNHDVVR